MNNNQRLFAEIGKALVGFLFMCAVMCLIILYVHNRERPRTAIEDLEKDELVLLVKKQQVFIEDQSNALCRCQEMADQIEIYLK